MRVAGEMVVGRRVVLLEQNSRGRRGIKAIKAAGTTPWCTVLCVVIKITRLVPLLNSLNGALSVLKAHDL